LNFDDECLIHFKVEDFQLLLELFGERFGKQTKFYFDEIQNVSGWERFVRRLVSVCLSTYFLIKKVFLALGQKNETSLHRKSATEICRGLREIFFISKGLLSVKKHIYLPLLSLKEALRTRSVSC